MKSPYEILGIPLGADETALREAYRRLARAYEGDAKRMREIDEAYDAIILSRGQAGFRGQTTGCRGQRVDYGGTSVEFDDIRQRLHAGRYDDAVTLLDGMPAQLRTAEWHYLKGCAQRGRGWLEQAEQNFARAARMDPENNEYREARDQMHAGRCGTSRNRGGDDDMCCKICAGIACLDCLCDIC